MANFCVPSFTKFPHQAGQPNHNAKVELRSPVTNAASRGQATIDAIYSWTISRKKRNQAQHAANGNSRPTGTLPKAPPVSSILSASQKVQLQQTQQMITTAVNTGVQKEMELLEKRIDAKMTNTVNLMANKQLGELANLTKLVTSLREEKKEQRVRVAAEPPLIRLAQTTINPTAVTDAIQATNWEEYLNAIGNEGRWILLQQMANDKELKKLTPLCADDPVQEAIKWLPFTTQIVDAVLKASGVPMQDATVLQSNMGESLVRMTNRRMAASQGGGVKRSHKDLEVADNEPPKRPRIVPSVPRGPQQNQSEVTEGWNAVRNLLHPAPPSPPIGYDALLARLASLEQAVASQGPTNETTGRSAMYATHAYNPAYVPAPPSTKSTTAKTALDEVHAWLNGKSPSFPSFERIFKAAQKAGSFDRKSLTDVREAVLLLQHFLLNCTPPVPPQREKELRRTLLDVVSQLNEFTGSDSTQRQTTCQQFCEAVIREAGFGHNARAVLINGIVTDKNAEAKYPTNSYPYRSYGQSRFGYGKNSYGKNSYGNNSYQNSYGPRPGYRDRVRDGDYYASGRFVPGNRRNNNEMCFYCAEIGHRRNECPYQLTGDKVDRSKFCTVWNSKGRGACFHPRFCKKVHRCLNCGRDHPAMECRVGKN